MANTSAPFGFKPYRYLNGTPWNGQVSIYWASENDSTAIYKGDMVTDVVAAGRTYFHTTGKYPAVSRADAGDVCVGVAIGFSTVPFISANPDNLYLNMRPASKGMYVFVVDDPNVVFLVQESEVTADIAGPIPYYAGGVCADLVAGGGSSGSTAGNDTTGISYMCLDSSDAVAKLASAGSAQLKILRLADIGNNALGAYAIWEVIMSEHYMNTQPYTVAKTS